MQYAQLMERWKNLLLALESVDPRSSTSGTRWSGISDTKDGQADAQHTPTENSSESGRVD